MRLSDKIWGEIENGSIFIADSHQNAQNRHLEQLWTILEREESNAPIFLMGDIFDMLFGEIDESFAPHILLLARISALGARRKIYWCEGNHDFNLTGKIKNVCVISRENQPAKFAINGGFAYLAHGDLGVGLMYEIYTRILRNRAVLKFLGFLNRLSKGTIFRKICERVERKGVRCGVSFSELFLRRAKFYKGVNGAVFEGHFHSLGEARIGALSYFAIPSLSCNESYFVVELTDGLVLYKTRSLGVNG